MTVERRQASGPARVLQARRRWRRIALAGAFAGLVVAVAGCAQIGYLAQSVNGHLRMVAAARPVPDWVSDSATPDRLRERLRLSQQMRDFAVSELALPDNASYRRYADLGRSAAVWNVVAAPELSLQLKNWCYPLVGCMAYRGFFDRHAAEAAAADLQRQGLQVFVYGVPAYSTLGKLPGDLFADPLLNTFVNYPEGDLANMLFHELAHQVVFAGGDTVFNESFATAVGRIGGDRWLDRHGSAAARAEFERNERRRADFRDLALTTRRELEAVYDSPASEKAKRAARDVVMAGMRQRYERLKQERWNGFAGYDEWVRRANNASLGLVAAYNELVPGFARLFESAGRDFPRFYTEVRRLAALPLAQRRAELEQLARLNPSSPETAACPASASCANIPLAFQTRAASPTTGSARPSKTTP